MDYTTLFNTIKTYTENEFPETTFSGTDGVTSVTTLSPAQINIFIQQAEKRIYNTVQLPSLRKNVTGSLTSSNKYLSAPLDFLAVYSMAVIDTDGSYKYLLNKDVNYIREAYPTPTDTAIPKYYALFGPTTTSANPPTLTNELTFIVGPTPNFNYGVELHYFFYPESIVTAGTTWLGDNYDPVLLYGSLVEAYTFMKGEQDMINLYNSKYMEAMAQLKRLGDGMERQDAYRSGQYRQQVT
jgi:hypothetical protein